MRIIVCFCEYLKSTNVTMVHLSVNESDWSKSIKYWKELTRRIFVSLDDQKKVDFLNKVIFNSSLLKNSLSTDNEIETKQENDNGQTTKYLAITTTRTTSSSDACTSGTDTIDPKLKKFIGEPVE